MPGMGTISMKIYKRPEVSICVCLSVRLLGMVNISVCMHVSQGGQRVAVFSY